MNVSDKFQFSDNRLKSAEVQNNAHYTDIQLSNQETK